MSRLAPLPIPIDASPELKEILTERKAARGFVPNSLLIMQRKPNILIAHRRLGMAVMDPEGEVNLGFKRLIGYAASRKQGCSY